jgi:hypothetical protein
MNHYTRTNNTSGPAGTRFVATGVGASAGATIGWAFSFGGVGANSGSFVLDPGGDRVHLHRRLGKRSRGRVGAVLHGEWAAIGHRLLHHHLSPGLIAGDTVQGPDGGSSRPGVSVLGRCDEPLPAYRLDPVLATLQSSTRCALCIGIPLLTTPVPLQCRTLASQIDSTHRKPRPGCAMTWPRGLWSERKRCGISCLPGDRVDPGDQNHGAKQPGYLP